MHGKLGPPGRYWLLRAALCGLFLFILVGPAPAAARAPRPPRALLAAEQLTAIDDVYGVTSGGVLDTAAAGLPGVLANDEAPAGAILTAHLVDDAVNGSLALNPDGSFTYVHSGHHDLSFELSPGSGNSQLEYGVATDIDGDTLVVGSNSHEGGHNWAGAAYVFRRQGVQWKLEAKLTPADPQTGHFFGWSVGVNGDTIVVSAIGDNAGAGAAYVFVYDGAGWVQQAKLTAAGGAAQDNFGSAVVIDDDTIVVGAHLHSHSGKVEAGAAYVFERSGASWSQQAKLVAADAAAGDSLGLGLAIDGDVVAAGAFSAAAPSNDAGAVYIFKRSGSPGLPTWSQEARLTAGDAAAGQTFGFSVALQANTLVVGANSYMANQNSPGAAYIFEYDGANWNQAARFEAPNATRNRLFKFGISVAVDGDTVLVGSHDQPLADRGAVYIYKRSGDAWSSDGKLTSLNPDNNEWFGTHVSIHGGVVAASANSKKFHPTVTDNEDGAAYVYQVDGALTDSFTYVAHDGLSDSNVATVFISLTTSSGPPTILVHPADRAVTEPDAATFTVQAAGDPPLSYQWRRDGVNIPGATDASYTLEPTSVVDNGAQFDVVVSNSAGSVTSQPATLTVNPPPLPPSIVAHPVDLTVTEPDPATFTVQAAGDPPLSYQWRRDGVNIPGATNTGYTLDATSVADNGAQFDVVVSNSAGAVTSQPAILTVNPPPPSPPSITQQPSDVTVTEPDAATFIVQAAGDEPLSYQWRRNGADIPGATNPSYTLNPTSLADDGAQFDVVVTNDAGSVTSQPATLTVNAQNLPPIAANDAYTVAPGGVIDTVLDGLPGVLANDTDPENESLSAILVDDVQHGTLTLNPDGSFIYTAGGETIGAALLPDAYSLVEYGVDTAIDGDTLVVGANSHEGNRQYAGAAYVFVREGDDWVLQARLISDRPGSNHFFGWSVDISGDTIVVGAPGEQSLGKQAGAAYVFTRSGTTWTQQAKLSGSDTAARDEFAVSVAIDGDTIAVGAHLNDHQAGSDAGATYIFTRSGAAWNQQAKILAADAAANAWFGAALALDGDTLAVGAMHAGTAGAGEDGPGATYIFTRSGATWSQQAQLTPTGAAAGDTFGFALALQNDTLVATANGYQGSSGFAGAAYIFERNGAAWSEKQELTAPDAGGDDYHGFGVSTALDGDTILVGADGDDESASNAGAVYSFQWNGASWTLQDKLFSVNPGAGEAFGVSVALHNATIVAGANSEKFNLIPDQAPGAAYVFTTEAVQSDSFTYRAHDGTHASNVATVFITIADAAGLTARQEMAARR